LKFEVRHVYAGQRLTYLSSFLLDVAQVVRDVTIVKFGFVGHRGRFTSYATTNPCCRVDSIELSFKGSGYV
jgi:hypothetical protein